jgi:hypothetical protein
MLRHSSPDVQSEENPYQAPQSEAHPQRGSYSPTDPLLAAGHGLTLLAVMMLFAAGSYSERVTYAGVNLLGIFALALFIGGLGLIGYAAFRSALEER